MQQRAAVSTAPLCAPADMFGLATKARLPWLNANIRTLLSYYPTNMPVADIAARTGRSKASIYGKARRLRLNRPSRNRPAVAKPDEILALPTSADNPIFVTEPIVLAGEEREHAPPPPPKKEKKPRPYVVTPLRGRQTVWFPELVERMIRLWLANVSHTVIAQVLGDKITGGAVQRKAYRIGLLPRIGITLVRDIEIAREIDQVAAALPKVVHDHRNKPLRLRTCQLSGVLCYTANASVLSLQAKETRHYQSA